MYFDEYKLDEKIDIAPVTIDYDEMLAFSKRYDNLPFHTDEEYAKTTPFGKIIAAGAMSFMCVWAKFLETGMIGNEIIAGTTLSMEWFKPVFGGDVLTGVCTVSKLEKRGSKNGLVELTIDAFNQNGDRVLTSASEIVVKCKPAE